MSRVQSGALASTATRTHSSLISAPPQAALRGSLLASLLPLAQQRHALRHAVTPSAARKATTVAAVEVAEKTDKTTKKANKKADTPAEKKPAEAKLSARAQKKATHKATIAKAAPAVAAAAAPTLEKAEPVKPAAAAAVAAPVATAAPQTVSPEEAAKQAELAVVASQFDKWNDALQTGDPRKVAALYSNESSLLGTISNVIRNCEDSKADYFDMFLKLQPHGTILTSNIRFLDSARTIACNSGIYMFEVIRDGTKEENKARYSFIYNKDKETGDWKIVEHHSSWMPEDPVPVNAASLMI